MPWYWCERNIKRSPNEIGSVTADTGKWEVAARTRAMPWDHVALGPGPETMGLWAVSQGNISVCGPCTTYVRQAAHFFRGDYSRIQKLAISRTKSLPSMHFPVKKFAKNKNSHNLNWLPLYIRTYVSSSNRVERRRWRVTWDSPVLLVMPMCRAPDYRGH